MRFLTSSVARRNPNTWYMKQAEAGGGILNWLGCHWFDLMRYITSSEVSKVSSIEANVSGQPIDVEDAAAVSLQFANGMIGSLHAGYFTPGDGEVSFCWRGSEGWAKWEEAEKAVTIKSINPAWASAPNANFGYQPPRSGAMARKGASLSANLPPLSAGKATADIPWTTRSSRCKLSKPPTNQRKPAAPSRSNDKGLSVA